MEDVESSGQSSSQLTAVIERGSTLRPAHTHLPCHLLAGDQPCWQASRAGSKAVSMPRLAERLHNCSSFNFFFFFFVQLARCSLAIHPSAPLDRLGLQRMGQFCWHVDVPPDWMNLKSQSGQLCDNYTVAALEASATRVMLQWAWREIRHFTVFGWWWQ